MGKFKATEENNKRGVNRRDAVLLGSLEAHHIGLTDCEVKSQ